MNENRTKKRTNRRHAFSWFAGTLFAVVLVIGTLREPNFWQTSEQRGDALFQGGRFKEAATVYTDPRRIGIAQYRDGNFEDAAKTFARVPGATGAFNEGNALLMHGKYEAAIAAYDRALSFRPDWNDAEENKALAGARKAMLEASDKNREQEQTGVPDEPDQIAFDQKGGNKSRTPDLATEGSATDADLQATWLRRIQTTPGDFLRAKFGYEAAHLKQGDTK
ncbi:MAG: tetratricopeptide repeat protein [Chthoniobacterales bacterium]